MVGWQLRLASGAMGFPGGPGPVLRALCNCNIDVSNPAAPLRLGSYLETAPGSGIHDLSILGRFAYAACGPDGILVLDLSDPRRIIEADRLKTPGSVYGVDVVGGQILVIDSLAGFMLFQSVTAGGARPLIEIQPKDQTIREGEDAQFEITAVAAGPLSCQWRFNGQAIPGATNPVLSFSQIRLDQAGNYDVAISNNAGSVNSRAARVSVTPQIVPPPQIQAEPGDLRVVEGDTPGDFEFSVEPAVIQPACYFRVIQSN